MIKKVRSQKLYEQVEDQIRDMIIKGVYEKGKLLPSEKELMDMTGVSRITVREALRELAEVGIIETHKGKGSIVLIDGRELLSYSGMEESFNYRKNFELSIEIRLLIEPEIAKQAALLATDEDIDYLEQFIIQDKRVNNMTNNAENDIGGFHKGILKILNNPVLSEFFDSLVSLEMNRSYTKLIPPDKQSTISHELDTQHFKILEAIKEGNGEFAYFYMKEHTLYIMDLYTKYFNIFLT